MHDDFGRDAGNADDAHWIARGMNLICVFSGVWMATGRFWPAAILAVVTTVMAIIGYGWHILQAFGTVAMIYGLLRVFGAVPVLGY